MKMRCMCCKVYLDESHDKSYVCDGDFCNRVVIDKLSKNHDKMIDANPDMYATCPICGYKAADLNSHMNRDHKLSIEEVRSVYPNYTAHSKAKRDKLRDMFLSDTNPARNHDGLLSPVSKMFLKYEGLTEVQKQDKICDVVKKIHGK